MPEPAPLAASTPRWLRPVPDEAPLTEAEHEAQRVAERREKALKVFDDRVPPHFAEARTDRPDMLVWAAHYARDSKSCPWLLVSGPTGTGKTYLGYATVRAVAETGTQRSQWRAMTSADLLGSLRKRGFSEAEDELAAISRVPLLMLDDLGAANLTGWTEDITYRLVNHRYEYCLPMIITTNVAPAHLAAAIGERTASRLLQMCNDVLMKGDDRRLQPRT